MLTQILRAVRNITDSQDILAYIPVNNNYEGTIDYVNAIGTRIPFTRTTLPQKVDFYWTLGNRTTFQPLNFPQNYLSFQGSPFFIVVRFFILSQTSQIDNLNFHGDKYIESSSNYLGSRKPSEAKFKGGPYGRPPPRDRKKDDNTGRPMPKSSRSLGA